LIGLPEFMDSTTANSRLRSWRMRAMRYRYLARSRPGSFDQLDRCASWAAATARLTSAFEACATLASGSSVAGLMTVNVLCGFDGLNWLPMNSPYSRSMRMWSVASGAAAYSHGTSAPEARPHELAAGRVSGFLVRVIAVDYRTLSASGWPRVSPTRRARCRRRWRPSVLVRLMQRLHAARNEAGKRGSSVVGHALFENR
jgi:hypothetical protein